ncbi:MAG: glycosyltransferase family 4 protein [Planctomycetes bacterium]|nr:glycosyltransferase family 4 protein [Planctomycetota bacterium]
MPWMATRGELACLRRVPGLKSLAPRLARRRFARLTRAPRIEGRWGEWGRMAKRVVGGSWADERLSYQANDWLMRTMRRECRRSTVTAVHAYEDCSLWQFEEASRLGKACIYDMPIGCYQAWEQTQAALARRYAAWLPPGGLDANRYVRPEQKAREMELANLVLAPSAFVRSTIQQFTDKKVALAPYGVDLEFWHPGPPRLLDGPIRFIYAGQCSLRKGIPVLFRAWEAAALKDASLVLVGSWKFDDARCRDMPKHVVFLGPMSAEALLAQYQAASVFVFPSYFEGFGLVITEAMACGLPVITTEATAGPDILDESTGRVLPTGDVDSMVESLRWFAAHRDRLPAMKQAARAKAETCTWERYRQCVSDAVTPFV